jgi:hypothetical protein
MRALNRRAPRIAGLLALALGAVALLALSGVAAAKDHHGDHGDGHGHGRHRHHHHQFPMQEAGTISSFDTATGKLTIALTGGESVTGLVTEDTRIRCEGFDDRRSDRRDHGGDDHGGRGNEPGDDNGGDNSGSGGPGPSNGSGPGPSGEGAPAPVPGQACTVASLVPGAVVGDAELRLEGGAAVFEEVELGFHS